VSCYNASTTCSSATSNQGGSWTSTDFSKVNVVGGFPTVVTGVAAGTATVSDTVTGEGTASGTVTVSAPAPSTLSICDTSCSSGIRRDTGAITLGKGATASWVACYGTTPCVGEVQENATWTSDTAATATVTANANPATITAIDQNGNAQATVTATTASHGQDHGGVLVKNPTCFPSSCTAAQKASICLGSTGTFSDGCSGSITCTGTKSCSWWREVAP
jgi:hypothetical protein